MKKLILVGLGLALNALIAGAQQKVKDGTTINGNLPNKDAILELESSNKGLLHTRVALRLTTEAFPLSAHIAGMMVYNTVVQNDVVPGIYYNDGSKWILARAGDYSSFIVQNRQGTSGTPGLPGQTEAPARGVNVITNDTGTYIYDLPTKSWVKISGMQGAKGDKGEPGQSAQDIWKVANPDKNIADYFAALKGDAGAIGIPGSKEEKGDVGVAGPSGLKGDKGDAGAIGIPGSKGEKGDVGVAGPSGLKGDKGDAGAIGIPGSKGEKGDTGLAGAQGLKGEKGDTGIAGAYGLKGDKGDAGAIGIPGSKGEKGDTGLVGPPGLKGEKGDTGLAGTSGLKGDKGDTGAKGNQGNGGVVTNGTNIIISGAGTTSSPYIVNATIPATTNELAAVNGNLMSKVNGVSTQNVPILVITSQHYLHDKITNAPLSQMQ